MIHVIISNSTDNFYKMKLFHILGAIIKIVIPSKIIPYMLLVAPSIVHGISDFDKNIREIAAKIFWSKGGSLSKTTRVN